MAERYDERYRGESRGERGYGRDDRGFMERAGDEVRSWFGDEDAERRRRQDEMERERRYRSEHGYSSSERGWTGERWDRPERWSGDYGRSEYERGEYRRPDFGQRDYGRGELGRGEFGRSEYDRSGATSRGWNEPRYGYRPSAGFGFGEQLGRSESDWGRLGRGESRGVYEDERGRVHEFEHRAAGSFAGRGPKGYRRSDERIREDICDRLADDWRIDASEIEVTVSNGEVTLAGMVHSRDEKRKSEDLVEDVSGVRDVRNHLRVGRWQESGAQTGSTGATSSSGTGTTSTSTTVTPRR